MLFVEKAGGTTRLELATSAVTGNKFPSTSTSWHERAGLFTTNQDAVLAARRQSQNPPLQNSSAIPA
jgi:hypothetical protein